MTEAELIARTRRPITVDSLATELAELGTSEGDVVLVHSSLSSLGWVNEGAVAVVQALIQAVGESGTIVMPSQSWQISDPIKWMRQKYQKIGSRRFETPCQCTIVERHQHA